MRIKERRHCSAPHGLRRLAGGSIRPIYSMFLNMIAGVRLGLRAASMLVVGLAASVPVPASARLLHAPQQFASISAVEQSARNYHVTGQVANRGARFHALASTGLRPPVTVPTASVTLHLTRRIFVEDTPPPSGEVLRAARLRAPMKPYAVPPVAPPALRKSSTSVANRQRAP
jgi:hypothetical protein